MGTSFRSALRRYPSEKARRHLAVIFDLPYTSQMQDWEVEVSNPDRIREFIKTYEDGGLDENELFVLMNLIIASFDEAEQDSFANPEWLRARELLLRDCELHAWTIWYWSDLAAALSETPFQVTRHMRPIWERVVPVIGD